MTVEPGAVLLGEFSIGWGEAAVATLVAGGPLPDAVVCADDLIALGVTRACRAHGVAVPGRVRSPGSTTSTSPGSASPR